jgi:hypothetical protein
MLWGLALFLGKVLVPAWCTCCLNPTYFIVIFSCEAWVYCFRNICCRQSLWPALQPYFSYSQLFYILYCHFIGPSHNTDQIFFQILYFPFLLTGFVAPFAYSNVLSMWWAFMLWQHQFIRCSSTIRLVLLITVLRNGLLLLIVWV